MYKVIWTRKFKKALKKIERSGRSNVSKARKVVKILASGKELDAKFQDHKLHGELSELRECHIKSDLLLIYRKDKENLILVLVNTGSHDELFD